MRRYSGLASFSFGFLLFLFALQTVSAQSFYSGPRSHPVITHAIDDSDRVTLKGNTRPEARMDNDRGRMDDNFRLEHMLLQLKRSADVETALEEFIQQLQTPGSSNYHKWITAQEFGTQFGVAPQDIEKVTAWLQNHNLQVNVVYPSGMLIDFSGTAGEMRKAFGVDFHYFDDHGWHHFGNTGDPKIPAALAPVVAGIVSLHDFRPRVLHEMRGPSANYTISTSLGDLYAVAPADLATIYNLNPLFSTGYSGQGQTIVVIEDTDVFSAADWGTFRSKLGLSSYTSGSLTTVYPAASTGTNNCNAPGVVSGNDAEAILDAEWASAAAPSAAIQIAACADTTTTFGGLIALENILNAQNPPPALMSMSYGQCETENGSAANAAYNSAYQLAVTEGVSVFVASGDSGAAGCSNDAFSADHGIGVNAFASTPYNVAVGGTDFSDTFSGTISTYWGNTNNSNYGSALSYIPEIPWNDSCAGALLSQYEGYAPYGRDSLCNDTLLGLLLHSTVAGGGGPSGCATGAPFDSPVVGGTCQGWAKPWWQSVFGNPADGVRDLPDVSLFAANGLWDHYYVFCWSDVRNGGSACSGAPSGWSGAGGTSFSSPIMAGIQALVNQKTGSRQGNPNPIYYELASAEYGSSQNSACNSSNGNTIAASCVFNDVTLGDMAVNCNGFHNCYLDRAAGGVLSTSDGSYQPAYAATSGWDFATGIGTVNAANLANNWPGSAPAPSFTLSASPNSVTVVQGNTGTSTITVTPQNGFNGSINWTASGLPSGVTASFGSLSSGGTSVLTFTASSSAATGTATVTITGTSGSLSATTSISLTVNAAIPPSFTLAASPNNLSMVQGSMGTSTVTVSGQNGFNGNVSFAASGLPSGVTATFAALNSSASTLTLSANGTATTGPAMVTITGTSGSLMATTTISLTVTAAPVPSFTLSASPNSVTVVQGATGTSSVSVTGQNGFNGNVSLSASGLPNGVTASFSGAASTTSPSTMTFTASGPASTGTFTVTVAGTSGSLASGTTVSLTVNAAPTPTFTLSATTAMVMQGGSATSAIAVTPENGFSGNVTLSASGLPSGVTASFNPTTTAASSTLTLSASGTTPTGNTMITITGTSGSLTNSTTVLLTVNATPAGALPSPWVDGDIGAAGVAGNATYTSGTFTVNGAGARIYGTTDAFNFVYQPLTGDGSIVARLVNWQGASQFYASAGVMIRDTLDPASDNAKTAYWPANNSIFFDVRQTPSNSTSEFGGVTPTLPYWIKVVRSGNAFFSYASPDGVNWTELGNVQTITMGQTVYVGLAVSSGSTAALATAMFDNVTVSYGSQPAPSPWADTDIGSVGVAGNSSYANGTFTVNGSGQWIYGSTDSFHFVYQPLTGDGTIVARLVNYDVTTTGYSSAGVMIRDTLDPSSDNAKTAFWPYYGNVFFDVRTVSGSSTDEVAGITATLQYWIKVSRSGNTFNSYASADGVNWVQVAPSQAITMGQTVNVGLAVTSGNTTALASATFDNVSITNP